MYLVGFILLAEFSQTFHQITDSSEMRQISQQDFETYKRVKHFMTEHKFSEENVRRYVKCKVQLEVSSKGMEPTTFESLDDAAVFMGVSKQTLLYAHKHRRPLITRQKGGATVSLLNSLSRHNMQYLSNWNKY